MEERPAPLAAELVNEFVRVAHSQIERVREMLAAEPALVNAVWDWGGGDFESALGAAAHMGAREIAEHLLARGARLDIPAAVMLGKLAVVRAAVEDDPNVLLTPGAHGIPLIVHARQGGEAAAGVLAFLEERLAAQG